MSGDWTETKRQVYRMRWRLWVLLSLPVIGIAALLALPWLLPLPPTISPPAWYRPGSNSGFDPAQVLPAPMRPLRSPPVKDSDAAELQPDELVLVATIGEEARAYPINMLTGPSREIFNDVLAGQPIAATW